MMQEIEQQWRNDPKYATVKAAVVVFDCVFSLFFFFFIFHSTEFDIDLTKISVDKNSEELNIILDLLRADKAIKIRSLK